MLPGSVDTLVVGAGFGGLGMASRLLAADPDADVLVVDKADGVGGTWRANTYPGCACDVPTSLYSYSFAPHPGWSHTFARQPEILDYLERFATTAGLRDRIVGGCEVLGAAWDSVAGRWQVTTSLGDVSARFLVAATGALSAPSVPDLPGTADFPGVSFHSATWRHDHDLTGKRVAVIGTGASAVQFVPEIAERAAHVTVFQRTPAWVIPRPDRAFSATEKALYRRVPLLHRMVRGTVYTFREFLGGLMAHATALLPVVEKVSKAHLRRQVRDPELRRRLTPDFRIGCKRILLSNDWWRTLDRPDVTLVDERASALTASGVVDATGTEHAVDTIVWATGFTPTEPPIAHALRGESGSTLAEQWAGSPAAYKGTTVHGFPNLFLLFGPNTNLGHGSIVYMLESQIAYAVNAVTTLGDGEYFDVTRDAEAGYNDAIQRSLRTTVWNAGGCSSWYVDATGRNSVQWPTFTFVFRRALRRFDRDAYAIRRVGERVPETVVPEAPAG